MHKLEFEQAKRETRRTVGKFDFERIVGQHALQCLDILANQNRAAFEKGAAWSSLQKEWEDSVLLSMFVDADQKDYEFEKAVRKVIRNFFKDCVSILKNEMQRKDANNAQHVSLIASMQQKRSANEIQHMISCYKQALQTLALHVRRDDEVFYIHAVGLLYAANKLGYFLDMELSK